EPIAALYEQGKVHHVGRLDALENEMISWQPGISSWSPNRIDALVWVLTELMTGAAACNEPVVAVANLEPPRTITGRERPTRIFEPSRSIGLRGGGELG